MATQADRRTIEVKTDDFPSPEVLLSRCREANAELNRTRAFFGGLIWQAKEDDAGLLDWLRSRPLGVPLTQVVLSSPPVLVRNSSK